jgi:glycosyltransferase involved in cell wall biosynthesis
MDALKNSVQIPLVIIGNGKGYKQKVKRFILSAGLEDRVIFLSEKDEVKDAGHSNFFNKFPAIYQMAKGMIYPSFYEGFGIPVLEALWSRIPVITSSASSLTEAGGPGAFYVDPSQPEEIGAAMTAILKNKNGHGQRIEQGRTYAQNFTIEKTTRAVMDVYEKLLL